MAKDSTPPGPGNILPHVSDKALHNLRDTALSNAEVAGRAADKGANDKALADVAQQILNDRHSQPKS